MAATDRVTVLYIMGLGRSGSTVLSGLLGEQPGVEGVGELGQLPVVGWSHEQLCACRLPIARCPFWNEVRQRWARSSDRPSLKVLFELQRKVERLHNWGKLAAPGRWPTFERYQQLTRELLKIVSSTSGCRVLVDSSKRPMRALALSRIEAVDVRTIHLVRDGRGVAHSLQKSWAADVEGGIAAPLQGRDPLRTGFQWLAVNWLAECVGNRISHQRSVRVRYEDLMGDAENQLLEIGRQLGLDLSVAARRAGNRDAISTNHMVAGNRLRVKGPFRLRLDDGWLRNSSAKSRGRFVLTAWPLLRRYGYLHKAKPVGDTSATLVGED